MLLLPGPTRRSKGSVQVATKKADLGFAFSGLNSLKLGAVGEIEDHLRRGTRTSELTCTCCHGILALLDLDLVTRKSENL